MLITQEIEVVLSAKNIGYYRDLGYKLPYHLDNRGRIVYSKEILIVKIKDAQKKSLNSIQVICDYCNKEYTTKIIHYFNGHKEINKDSCNKCKSLKTNEIYLHKYGTTSIKTRSEIEGFKIGRNKIDGKEVVNNFIKRGYLPQFDESFYNSCTQKLPFICPLHLDKGILYISYDGLLNCENACSFCAQIERNNKMKYSYDYVKEKFEEKDYTLLSKEYNNCDEDLEYICNRHPEEGIQIINFYHVLNSTNNCKLCRYDMQSGEFHYNWQGGISSEREQFKITPAYKNWRLEVFKRDNYICKCCGKTNTYLEAHHKYSYSMYPELRTDINNGITLCSECHSVNIKGSFHNVYTQFNNTPEQLEEYIKNKKCNIK